MILCLLNSLVNQEQQGLQVYGMARHTDASITLGEHS